MDLIIFFKLAGFAYAGLGFLYLVLFSTGITQLARIELMRRGLLHISDEELDRAIFKSAIAGKCFSWLALSLFPFTVFGTSLAYRFEKKKLEAVGA